MLRVIGTKVINVQYQLQLFHIDTCRIIIVENPIIVERLLT
jgi:hypothetical protein